MNKEKLIESRIITLRLHGMTESEIIKHIKNEGEDILLYIEKIVHICNHLSVKKREDEEYVIKNSEELDDMIFKLKERVLLWDKMAKELEKIGIIMSIDKIISKCIEIYSERGIKMPKNKKPTKAKPPKKPGKRKKISKQTLERIYNLRESNFSYRRISEQLEIEGLDIISEDTVRNKCKKIYAEKGKKEPKAKMKFVYDKYDDKIFELRQQELSYAKIATILQLEGLSYDPKSISKRCKKIYAEKNMEEPKCKKTKQTNTINKSISDLIDNGLSCIEITQNLQASGIKITENAVCCKCRKICKERGIEIPESLKLPIISPERVFRLRQKRKSCEEIANIFAEEGIIVTAPTIRKISKEIYKKKKMEEPKLLGGRKKRNTRTKLLIIKMNDTALIKIFKKIQIKKKASDEQLQKLAEYYGIDYKRLLNEIER